MILKIIKNKSLINLISLNHKSLYSNANLNDHASQEYDKVMKLIEHKSYEKAASNLSILMEKLEQFKGLYQYNILLKTQAECFFQLRKHKDAEMNYLNILQYMKINPSNYDENQIFQAKLELLNQYQLSNVDKVI